VGIVSKKLRVTGNGGRLSNRGFSRRTNAGRGPGGGGGGGGGGGAVTNFFEPRILNVKRGPVAGDLFIESLRRKCSEYPFSEPTSNAVIRWRQLGLLSSPSRGLSEVVTQMAR